ncbi:hypothetical protein LZ30DRAFT_788311 [Colletotrichum cereale]|nr:hypothetical protein LZ30DRAFT_788311 [Colletotrichum cereale]
MSDKDGSLERLVEYVDCTRQTNHVDCGVAVIVNAIRVISGTETYSEPTDFDVWRQVLAVLLKPGCCTSLVEKQRFAALFEILPIPTVGPQPRAHAELMSSSDCKLWCQSTMAYAKRLRAAIKKQTRLAKEARIKALGVLKDVGELLVQVSQAGTGDWRPGFSLKSANSRRDSFSPSRNEIYEALWYYECAKKAFRDSRFSDTNRDSDLNHGVKRLQELSRLRSETVNRLDRVIDMINADVKWLHQLHDPQDVEDSDSNNSQAHERVFL